MAIDIEMANRASEALRQAADRVSGPELTQAVAQAVAERLRGRFAELDGSRPNKQGWPRQHFWLRVRDSVTVSPDGSVQVNHPALALRVNGGRLAPRNVRFLTIPAVAEAYGKRASDFGNLRFGYAADADGGKRPALVEATPGQRVRGAQSEAPRAIFWLAKKADQPPDGSILPGDDELQQVAQEAAQRYAAQQWTGGLP